MDEPKYKIEKCDTCPIEVHEGFFCRCEMRNIAVGKMIRESGKSPWLNEMTAQVLKLDTVKEIFDLWYELSYFKLVFQEMLNQNPELVKSYSPEMFDKCRMGAQEILRKKFGIDLAYSKPGEKNENPNAPSSEA